MGFGRAIIQKLRDKLHVMRRRKLTLEVCEENLDGQLFFREMGFHAVGVLRDFYEDSQQDAYQMVFELTE
jgi:ribosomal-protein-alanine N-acetyltransferase